MFNPKMHFRLKNTVSKWWHPKYGRYSDEIMNIINPSVDEEILEVGCGDGRYSVLLAKKGAWVTGVDLSQEMLQKCAENARREEVEDRITLLKGDSEELPFNNCAFKKSICIATLVHVPNYEKAIRELIRVTRAGGYIITENISFLNPTVIKEWGKHRFMIKSLKKTYREVAPYYPRTPWKILKAFKENGTKIENYFGYFILLPTFLLRQTSTFSYELKSLPLLKFFGSSLVVKALKLR